MRGKNTFWSISATILSVGIRVIIYLTKIQLISLRGCLLSTFFEKLPVNAQTLMVVSEENTENWLDEKQNENLFLPLKYVFWKVQCAK